MIWSAMHKAAFTYWRVTSTYHIVQCAAVMIHSSFRSVPPQKISISYGMPGVEMMPLGSLSVRPTCQPISPFTAFSPPTIRWTLSSAESSRFVTPSLFWPQTAIYFDLITFVHWESVSPTCQLTAIRIGPVQEDGKRESFQNQHACLSSDALIWTSGA